MSLRRRYEHPNKLSIQMGRLIRQARQEAGLSQAQLADYTSSRQATISDLENGKVEASVSMLVSLAVVLEKPISYFFPRTDRLNIPKESLTVKEQELLNSISKLDNNDLTKVIAIIRTLIDMADREAMKQHMEEIDRERTGRAKKKGQK